MIFNLALTIGLFGLIEIAFYETAIKFASTQVLRIVFIYVAAHRIQWGLTALLPVLGIPNDAVKFQTSFKFDWERFGVRWDGRLRLKLSALPRYFMSTVWLIATVAIMLSLFSREAFEDAQKLLILLSPDRYSASISICAVWTLMTLLSLYTLRKSGTYGRYWDFRLIWMLATALTGLSFAVIVFGLSRADWLKQETWPIQYLVLPVIPYACTAIFAFWEAFDGSRRRIASIR